MCRSCPTWSPETLETNFHTLSHTTLNPNPNWPENVLLESFALEKLHLSMRPCVRELSINPLDSKGNYSVTPNNTKLVHWPMTGGLLHLVQRGGAWADWAHLHCTKCNSPHISKVVCFQVCLFVGVCACVFVSSITLEPFDFEISSCNFLQEQDIIRRVQKWLHSDALRHADDDLTSL